MRLAALTFIIITSFGAVIAQDGAADLRSSKKLLEKYLIKYAPHVFDVEFVGCDANIKISSRNRSSFSFSPPSFAGGTFPRDDGSSSFSAGPGSEVRGDISSSRFVLILSSLESDDISIIPPFRGKMSSIRIVDRSRSGAIGSLRRGKLTPISEFKVLVNHKKAANVADTLRSVIAQCKLGT